MTLLGLDPGGTKLASAVFTEDGRAKPGDAGICGAGYLDLKNFKRLN